MKSAAVQDICTIRGSLFYVRPNSFVLRGNAEEGGKSIAQARSARWQVAVTIRPRRRSDQRKLWPPGLESIGFRFGSNPTIKALISCPAQHHV